MTSILEMERSMRSSGVHLTFFFKLYLFMYFFYSRDTKLSK